MLCEDVQDDITALVEDCLPADVRLQVEAHVAVCSACRRRLAGELTIKRATAAAFEPAPDELRARITATVQPRTRTRGNRRRRWFTGTAAAAAVVVVVLAVVLASSLFGRARQDTVFSALLRDYDREWGQLGHSAASGNDLTSFGFDAAWQGRVDASGRSVSVQRFTGPAGRVAVYRVSGAVPTVGTQPGRLADGTPVGRFAEGDEYRGLVWTSGRHTTMLVGTLDFPTLERVAALVRDGPA